MAASADDYFQLLGGSSAIVNVPKTTATRTAGGTTLTVDNCNWDQTTGKIFATYQVDVDGTIVDGTQTMWKGVVTSTTSIGSLTRLAGAADTGNAIGDYVELLPASAWGNNIATGLLVEHAQDGTHTAVTATSVSTDTISESTSAHGVNIDSLNIKDGYVTGGSGTGVKNSSLDTTAGALGGVWTDWTPTITSGGTISATSINTARYMQLGKTVWYQLDVSFTMSGTATNSIYFTLPVDAKNNANSPIGSGSLSDTVTTGAWGQMTSGSTTIALCRRSDNSTISNGTSRILRMFGTYEIN